MPARCFDPFLPIACALARPVPRPSAAGRRIALGICILLALLPAVIPGAYSLRAEESASPIDEAIEGLANWGPLYWKSRIRLKDAGYDNNLYNAEQEPVGAFTATLSPGIDLFMPIGKRNMLWVADDLDFVFYEKDPPGIYLNNDGALGYDLHLKRIHLALGDRLTTRRQRPNDEIDARVRRENNLLSGKLLLQVSPRVEAGLIHESDKISYDDASVEEPGVPDSIALVLDRTERQNGLVLRYAALPRTTFLIRVRHTGYDFKDPASTRESSELRYLAGAEFDPTGIINGELEVGYSSFTADLAPEQDFDGLVGRAKVTWQMKSWLHFRVTAVRDRQFSTYATNLFYLRRSLEGRASLRMGGAGWLDLGYGQDRSDYPVEDVNSGTEDDPVYVSREDRFSGPILGFRYQPREGMVLGFEATYRSRESNFARDYDRLFVAVSITLSR